MLRFETEEKKGFTVVRFEMDNPITPGALREIKVPEVLFNKGVVISGRGPIWLYGYLIHAYHPTQWVGTFDPRLNAAVVVSSHTPGIKEGDLIYI